MPEATDQQMQTFANERHRTFAEKSAQLVLLARQHKAAIDDVYARASGLSAWADGRTDGPPYLLQSGDSANPDDMLVFNAFITAVIDVIDGTKSTDGDKAAVYDSLRTNYTTLLRGVVRAID